MVILETWSEKCKRWGYQIVKPTFQFLIKRQFISFISPSADGRCVYVTWVNAHMHHLSPSSSLFYFSNPSWVLQVCKDKELLSGAVLSTVCWVMAEVPIDPPVP